MRRPMLFVAALTALLLFPATEAAWKTFTSRCARPFRSVPHPERRYLAIAARL